MAIYYKLLLYLFVYHLGVMNLYSQKNVESQQLLWTRYNLKININDTYSLKQELEERTYWFPWRQHQFISRTQLDRKLGKGWNAGIGVASFLQSLPHDPEIPIAETKSELRPMLEIGYWSPISKKIGLHHRYWSEFRFFEQTNGSFDFANNRTRYKLELRYAATPQINFKAFDEILLNIGGEIVQNVFDQNRYGASIQYMPFDKLGFEVGYINWFQQQKSGVDLYNRHIIRLTIHQNINLKSHKK
ncbi:DUF2490 domain-containing protein [Arenibacter sp. BSSL-BM3]|uniref:DUF2490 domain-containing protein n=1 Tax=Arenibacter arenosicollis TaxID=2762274 RepID=A0ABR7QQI5_9FLAO|nr:DUF2490 domain-containing protein [Arenibacter arenosicollis]MBC8769324.1 DUF2490 domain-containing protein [Arenibacter arenosicollis]